MRILISGSHGLIGSALSSAWAAEGHEIIRLVRGEPPEAEPRSPGAVHWDPAGGAIEAADLEGLDAVVHLAGENLGAGRWTRARKAAIVRSRVEGTALLARALAKTERPPGVFVCASAVGFYGDCGDAEIDESAPAGTGFLAELVRAWEQAAAPASAAGIRVVFPRFGVVLTPKGGALARQIPIFRAGAGAKLGSGRQWLSWISLHELPGLVGFLLARRDLSGPVNATSPDPVTNAAFTRALASALSRPAFLTVPPFVLRIAFGRMADEMLLSGARVLPRRLLEAGYVFREPALAGALRNLLAGS